MTSDPTTSLEIELARIADDAVDRPVRRAQLIAFRFYLRRVVASTIGEWTEHTRGFTRYLTLLNALSDWQHRTKKRVLLLTFNYDTLLDRACEDVVTGWSLGENLSTYVERDDFRLFKLHGSTEWSRTLVPSPPFSPKPIGTAMTDAAMALAEKESPVFGPFLGKMPEPQIDTSSVITVPALAVPMRNKTEFECPPGHLDLFRADLPHVSHLLIVGWRAAESHVVNLLAGSSTGEGLPPGFTSLVVSGSSADNDEVRTNLGVVHARSRSHADEPDGFTGLITRLSDHLMQLLGPI